MFTYFCRGYATQAKSKVVASYITSKSSTNGPLDWKFGVDNLMYEDSFQQFFLFAEDYRKKFDDKREVFEHCQKRANKLNPQMLTFTHSSVYMKSKDMLRLRQASQ